MLTSSEYTVHLPAGISIGVSSSGDLEIGPAEELLLGAYLPGVRVGQGLAGDTDWHISHLESAEQVLRQGEDEIEIQDSWNGRFPMDLPHLLYGVARGCWIRRNLFPAHAACVRDYSQTTLLPGHSGTGKSSVALRLAREHSHEIVSGNTTLTGVSPEGILPIAGTRTMTLRTADYADFGATAARSVAYGERTAFRLESDQSADPAIATIGRIALIRLSDTENRHEVVEPLSALHRLYPYFLDTVHQDVVVCGGRGVYVGSDPAENRHYLASTLRTALGQIPVIEMTGTSQEIAEGIAA